jgi:hypothetical protein
MSAFAYPARTIGRTSVIKVGHRAGLSGGAVMKIVVIGGTGLIGSKVVAKLKQKGHEALAAAPNTGINTITGEGLKEAMVGAQVVVDCQCGRRLQC